MSAPPVGVLALQGAYARHGESFERLGVRWRPVRSVGDLHGLGALVIPGGESTAISNLILRAELYGPLSEEISGGLPVMGTCAGMILLAGTVLDGRPDQISFGAIDIAVRRNAYGRQVDSFETGIHIAHVPGGVFPAVFIRAPLVERVGGQVEVLATLAGDGHPLACRQGSVLVTSFHPELTDDTRVHRLFLDIAGEA